MAKLECKAVSQTYDSVAGSVDAVADVSFCVEDGESVAIIGPSGCGKSTLLMMGAGLLAPTRGEVLVDSSPVRAPREQTALILQDLGLLPWKTVYKNVDVGLAIRGMDSAQRKERTAAALSLVGLEGFDRRYPAELSGGMRQRLAFARAIALDADLVLMDEPLSALDAISREGLQQLLLDLRAQKGYASLLVTHSIEEAVFLGQRVVVMTPRPGTIAGVVENPGCGGEGYRASDEFARVAKKVRSLLEEASGGVSAATATGGAAAAGGTSTAAAANAAIAACNEPAASTHGGDAR